MTWSHSPSADRDEMEVYRLPRNEVLPWLSTQTAFLETTSTPANAEARRVIHLEQYPKVHGPSAALAEWPAWSAATVAREVEAFVKGYTAESLEGRLVRVGYTPVLADHVYVDGDLALPNAIVLGLPMRYEPTNAAPEPAAGEEVTCNYMELGGLTLALGAWLRESGFAAETHHPRGDADMECEALFIPHAVAAGFGELGRHGSLISRDFGPRVRLAMVTTDAPIRASGEVPVGVAEFCTWCTKCQTACPVDAIPGERMTLRGSRRYVVDTTACLPYFAETDGCGICIAVCPYNKPSEEASAAFTDNVLALDWVREARAIHGAEGIDAMERYVRSRKAARRTEIRGSGRAPRPPAT
jgi:ferredoxin